MKGITPVIAIILLLLITISMVGFAFVWFQRVAQTATDSADNALDTQLSQQNQKVRIDSTSGTTIYLRSTGSQSLPASSVALYVNGTLVTSGNCPSASQASGATFSCASSVQLCSGSSKVKVTTPGNTDEVTC